MQPDWIKEIEDYCQLVGIIPQDLIELHKQVNKKRTAVISKPIIMDLTKPEIIGKPYNPFDNPLYKNKNVKCF